MYRKMMDVVGSERIEEYVLVPGCAEVIVSLVEDGYRPFVATSRADRELYAAQWFLQQHCIPINQQDVVNTNRGSKLEICREKRAAALVDDTFSKLMAVARLPMQLYFMMQPWNVHDHKTALASERVRCVAGWHKFYEAHTDKVLQVRR